MLPRRENRLQVVISGCQFFLKLNTMFRKLLWILAAFFALLIVGIAAIIRPDIPVSELEPRWGGDKARYLEIDGMRVHYRDEGNGPAVLLIHGTFASLHTFDPWVESMRDSLRIIRLDLPGFGLTGPQPQHDYSLAATLWVIDSLRQHLGLEHWAIGGNSLGGRLAYEYATRFPQHTTKLLLIDGAGFPARQQPAADSTAPKPAPRRNNSFVFQVASTPLVKYLLTVCTPRFWYKATLKQVFGNPERITEDLVDRYYYLLRREGNRAAFLKRGEAANIKREGVPTLPAPIPPDSVKIPVLIQWGEKDNWIPVANGRRFQQALPTSRLIVYPDAGHVPMEEIPIETGRDAKRFLLHGL
jgi:pimeloyl-ACP methyl ester carboxylesterase